MVYKRLMVNVSIRVILLTLTCIAISYVWVNFRDPLILMNLVALLILQVYIFIRSMNQVNMKLKVFFDSFKFDDPGFAAGDGFHDRSFQALYLTMSHVLGSAREMNLENERQKQYFKTMAEHVGVGLLAFNTEKEIKLINKSLKELLGIGDIKDLREFDAIKEGLADRIDKLRASDQKLITIISGNKADLSGETSLKLSVRCAEIRIEDEHIKLVTFQNIRHELEENEIESWQRVIRVLTHEVMNSTGPIASSAQTLLELLTLPDDRGSTRPGIHDQELRGDLLEGLKIIRERSIGLEEFVQQFRKVLVVPEPRIEKINVSGLFQGILLLFEKKLRDEDICIEIHVEPEELVVYADKKLIEQVMINLLNNSIDGLDPIDEKRIKIAGWKDKGRQCMISLTDNGTGIPKEDLDNIFFPFFTKKDGGSGIGLSLVRKIMKMHNGSIQVQSDPGKSTTFSLIF
jgi:nitrogen fixation/metabolism regulation signal transduction histidine kinase